MLLKNGFGVELLMKKALAEEIAAEDKAVAEAKAAEQMYPPAMQATVDTEIEAALSYRSQTCWEEEWRQTTPWNNGCGVVKKVTMWGTILKFWSTKISKQRHYIAVKLLRYNTAVACSIKSRSNSIMMVR